MIACIVCKCLYFFHLDFLIELQKSFLIKIAIEVPFVREFQLGLLFHRTLLIGVVLLCFSIEEPFPAAFSDKVTAD